MRKAGVVSVMLLLSGTRVGGQSSNPRVFFDVGAMGVGAITKATPGVFGIAITEGYLTQPNVMARASRGPIALTGTLNFEGYTLQRGELNAGIYGEGYADRRHPHTLVHEIMLSTTSASWRGVRASLAVGKGFTPFGTDDPMMRPMVKFPVNHHHAQIIERVQSVGALKFGNDRRAVTLEHAFFNGDEPVGPFIGPQWTRFGDSRATRLTLLPAVGVEVQASRAFVRSPGITQGGAFDHTQTSASLRFDRTSGSAMGGDGAMIHDASTHDDLSGNTHGNVYGDRRYLLVEVARTDEGFGPTRVFRFNSVLAEGLWGYRGWSVALRGERTERPESERLLNPFRIANGHIDFQLIGITQFTVATAHLNAPAWVVPRLSSAIMIPFIEVAQALPKAMRTPAVFVPREFYGANRLWSVTVGARVHVGAMRARMGRYGILN